MSIYVPYTYLVGWSSIKKYYYGVRFAKNCNPSDLWVKYFTSSKHVKQYRELYGEPDIIQIRKTFDNRVSAILWEEKVLRRLDIKNNIKMLNANVAGAITKNLDNARGKPGHMKGRKHTELTKQKMRKPKSVPSALKGRALSEDHKQKLKNAKVGYVPWNTGISTGPRSDSTKQLIRDAAINRRKSIPQVIYKPCLYCEECTVKPSRKYCSNSCKAKHRTALGINSLQHLKK
jgi:hypothetical protein